MISTPKLCHIILHIHFESECCYLHLRCLTDVIKDSSLPETLLSQEAAVCLFPLRGPLRSSMGSQSAHYRKSLASAAFMLCSVNHTQTHTHSPRHTKPHRTCAMIRCLHCHGRVCLMPWAASFKWTGGSEDVRESRRLITDEWKQRRSTHCVPTANWGRS